MAFAGAAAAAASCAAASAGEQEPLPPLLVTAAADRTLRLWNLDTMRRLRVIYNRPAETSALAVSRWAPLLGHPCFACLCLRLCPDRH